MTKILESSAERRIKALRQQLTLELFLRSGRCWEVVGPLRSTCNISAIADVPPQISSPEWLSSHIVDMHDTLLPSDSKLPLFSLEVWWGFLARLLLFDPPAGSSSTPTGRCSA